MSTVSRKANVPFVYYHSNNTTNYRHMISITCIQNILQQTVQILHLVYCYRGKITSIRCINSFNVYFLVVKVSHSLKQTCENKQLICPLENWFIYIYSERCNVILFVLSRYNTYILNRLTGKNISLVLICH